MEYNISMQGQYNYLNEETRPGLDSSDHVSADELPGMPNEKDTIFLVGSYTENAILAHIPKGDHGKGIYSFKLNAKTGKLEMMAESQITPNPAFIVQNPKRHDIFYATTECIHDDGEVITLKLQENGSMKELHRCSAMGKSTCYVNLHQPLSAPGRMDMYVVNYWDAKVTLFPMTNENGEPTLITSPSQIIMQPGAEYAVRTKPTREEHWAHRQRWPHSHCAVTEPYSKQHIFVPDLGQDKIFVYRPHIYDESDMDGKLEEIGEVSVVGGRGPRHIVFHPTLPAAYVVNELQSTVTSFRYHGDRAQNATPTNPSRSAALDTTSKPILSEMQTMSLLPDGVDPKISHSSEIRLHPSGKFLYIGNRGHESIAVFAVDGCSGELRFMGCCPSLGECPRNFNFDRTGRWIVVGNQNTNRLVTFAIDLEGRTGLLRAVHEIPMPSPNYIYAVPTAPHGLIRASGVGGDGEEGRSSGGSNSGLSSDDDDCAAISTDST